MQVWVVDVFWPNIGGNRTAALAMANSSLNPSNTNPFW